MALAICPIQSFGDVEDEIGLGSPEAYGEVLDRFKPDHLAQWAQCLLDGVDGLGFVPFGVEVGLREIVTEVPGGTGSGGDSTSPGALGRSLWSEIEGESYANCQTCPLSVWLPRFSKKGRPYRASQRGVQQIRDLK
jgi:hypothetical protein